MTTKALPRELRDEIKALTEVGLYKSEAAVLADAVGTLLAARLDLRVAVACRLYEIGRFSLGKATEWSGLSIEEMKEQLHRLGIRRLTEDDPQVLGKMWKGAAALAGRPEHGW